MVTETSIRAGLLRAEKMPMVTTAVGWPTNAGNTWMEPAGLVNYCAAPAEVTTYTASELVKR